MSRQKRKEKYFGDGAVKYSPHDGICSRDTLLPPGVVRLTDEAIGASRLLPDLDDAAEGGKKVEVAAFDFDGTCISGSSPKKLVSALSKRNLISPYKLLRVGLWGMAYKLNLPKDAEGVRTRVFSTFKGFSAVNVNDFLYRFYHRKIADLYRRDADACMIAHLEAGHVVVLVSASFEPIIAAAMTEHPIPVALASRMQIDAEGDYSGEVEGLCTEGPDKAVVLRHFLDEHYGEGNWELGWAYGDHYSDLTLLEEALHPCAVTPDGKLRRYAKGRGWTILDWQ